MTITSSVKLAGGTLSVYGRAILSGVSAVVAASSAAAGGAVDGVFLGADLAESTSRHVVSLGALRDVRFMACFRSRLWWMSQRMGDKGGDVPHETQFLLVESRGAGAGGEDAAYVVFLPLVEGAFRASLQGGAGDELELCVESGDADTRASSLERALFVGAAESDPFAAIAAAVAAAKSALKTFRVRAEKKLPGIVDYFGWCTWDAFYQDVTQEGVEAGLRSLVAGGAPPKFVIIDDGWQSVGTDQPNPADDAAGEAKQPRLPRLTGIRENSKFQSHDDPAAGIRTVVRAAKEDDAPGKHDFELLKKIVLPDGSVLRARLPGRPTKDCLFTDPARDGVSLLKIWNMNKFTGVLGVYNCQGAAWSFVEKKTMFHSTGADALTCGVRGSDVHLISEAATDPEWNGDCAIYRHASGDLVVLPDGAALPVSLKVLEQDILTVSPIKELAPGFRFAPVGLLDMFNSGAAVEGLTYHLLDGAKQLAVGDNGSASSSDAVGLACVEVRGCGRFGAYSSVRPRRCLLGSAQLEFTYDSSSGLVVLQLEKMPKERVHRIVFELC